MNFRLSRIVAPLVMVLAGSGMLLISGCNGCRECQDKEVSSGGCTSCDTVVSETVVSEQQYRGVPAASPERQTIPSSYQDRSFQGNRYPLEVPHPREYQAAAKDTLAPTETTAKPAADEPDEMEMDNSTGADGAGSISK